MDATGHCGIYKPEGFCPTTNIDTVFPLPVLINYRAAKLSGNSAHGFKSGSAFCRRKSVLLDKKTRNTAEIWQLRDGVEAMAWCRSYCKRPTLFTGHTRGHKKTKQRSPTSRILDRISGEIRSSLFNRKYPPSRFVKSHRHGVGCLSAREVRICEWYETIASL